MKKIKENDIFNSNMGITSFYQVTKVYDSGRVRVRKIEKEEIPTECGYEFLAKPQKNKFCQDDKGAIKLVQYFDDGTPYLQLVGYDYATLYKGKPVISSYWNVWMR